MRRCCLWTENKRKEYAQPMWSHPINSLSTLDCYDNRVSCPLGGLVPDIVNVIKLVCHIDTSCRIGVVGLRRCTADRVKDRYLRRVRRRRRQVEAVSSFGSCPTDCSYETKSSSIGENNELNSTGKLESVEAAENFVQVGEHTAFGAGPYV